MNCFCETDKINQNQLRNQCLDAIDTLGITMQLIKNKAKKIHLFFYLNK